MKKKPLPPYPPVVRAVITFANGDTVDLHRGTIRSYISQTEVKELLTYVQGAFLDCVRETIAGKAVGDQEENDWQNFKRGTCTKKGVCL